MNDVYTCQDAAIYQPHLSEFQVPSYRRCDRNVGTYSMPVVILTGYLITFGGAFIVQKSDYKAMKQQLSSHGRNLRRAHTFWMIFTVGYTVSFLLLFSGNSLLISATMQVFRSSMLSLISLMAVFYSGDLSAKRFFCPQWSWICIICCDRKRSQIHVAVCELEQRN